MKHTERWLTISVIVIALTILLLIIQMLGNYSDEVNRVNTTREDVNTATGDSESSFPIEEGPYREICKDLSISEIVEMPESLYCGGYKLEITGVDITRENKGWILDKELLEGKADFTENGDIQSEEQYIVIHMKLTAYEEYLPYVEEGKTSELYLNTMNLFLFTEEQEEIEGFFEPVGLSKSNGLDDKSTYRMELKYGVPQEIDMIFIDSANVLGTEENPIIVLKVNPSGIEYGSAPDLRKGMVLDVPN